MKPISVFQTADRVFREGGVFKANSIFAGLKISGKDRVNFLNHLLTIDVVNLSTLQGKECLILDSQSMVVFRLWIFSLPEYHVLILPYDKEKECYDYLEKRIFLEQVEIGEITPHYYFEKMPPLSFTQTDQVCHEKGITSVRLDCSGNPGYLSWGTDLEKPPTSSLFGSDIFNTLSYCHHPHLVPEGLPHNPPAMELPHWERFFDFDKGCYPGQEIIIRSRSRQQTPVRRYAMIRPINAEKKNNDQNFWKDGFEIKTSNLSLGKIISIGYSPLLKCRTAWVHFHKDFTVAGQILSVIDDTGGVIRIEVWDPHASENKTNHFRKAMDSGLKAFHQDNYDLAKEEFIRASALDPNHPDPWEALAVIEEKSGNLDEAIRLNKTFAEKNPDSPLAKTNLSRLYMLKGWIDKAEEEKRKATVLMFKAAAREKKLQDQQVVSPQDDQGKKKEIFRQVLNIDPKDEIAHFGLGKILFEEGHYQEAQEHFHLTLSQNPSYSLAYSFLAQSLIKEGNRDEAVRLLKIGIDKAREQGQMIPLRSMEDFLRGLAEQV